MSRLPREGNDRLGLCEAKASAISEIRGYANK